MSTMKVNTIVDSPGTGAPEFPNGVRLSSTNLTGIATQAEAQAGTANTSLMTPLRTKEAIASQAPIGKVFESSQITITPSSQTILTHNFGGLPKIVLYEIVCVTAEFGFSVGDRISLGGSQAYIPTIDRGIGLSFNQTNIWVRVGANSSSFEVISKSSGARVILTNSSWRLVVRAFA
jgi:hypothetical protein